MRQPVQPVTDRPVQRIFWARLQARRVFQRLQQHRHGVFTIVSDWAAALGRQPHRIGVPDLDKDVIGTRSGPLNRGDQPLAALVGVQIAHRAAALIRDGLSNLAREAALNVVLVEGKPLGRGKPRAGERDIGHKRRPSAGGTE